MNKLILIFVMVLSSVVILESNDPLDRLAARIESTPLYMWGFNVKVYSENKLPDTHKRLLIAAQYLGLEIKTDLPDRLAGMFSPAERAVFIDASLPLTNQVQVLAHELCHALQPPLVENWEREVFADACAYLVTRPEYDDIDTFAGYLARYRSMARATIVAHAAHIRWAANFLRMEPR